VSARRIAVIVAAAAVVVVAAATAVMLLRAPTEVASAADPDVTIECSASAGVDAATCLAWGDGIIGGEPPTFTFEMDSLSRLRLDRSWFGFGSECRASYVIDRYAEPAFTDEVACAEAT
jgi:hypothetical protein